MTRPGIRFRVRVWVTKFISQSDYRLAIQNLKAVQMTSKRKTNQQCHTRQIRGNTIAIRHRGNIPGRKAGAQCTCNTYPRPIGCTRPIAAHHSDAVYLCIAGKRDRRVASCLYNYDIVCRGTRIQVTYK